MCAFACVRVCVFGLNAVRIVAVGGAVGQATGSCRAVAVAARTGAGGRRAIGVVRVAARAGFATTLGGAGAAAGRRAAAARAAAVVRLRRRAVRVRVLLVGATRRRRRRIVHGVVAAGRRLCKRQCSVGCFVFRSDREFARGRFGCTPHTRGERPRFWNTSFRMTRQTKTHTHTRHRMITNNANILHRFV